MNMIRIGIVNSIVIWIGIGIWVGSGIGIIKNNWNWTCYWVRDWEWDCALSIFGRIMIMIGIGIAI